LQRIDFSKLASSYHKMENEIIKSPSTGNRERQKSISWMLTLSLVITIGLISTAMIAAMYLYRVKTAKEELNQQADELLVYLIGIVERPLWDMNEQDIITIGKVISRNELINNVTIKDSYGRMLYKFDREPRPNLIKRFGRVNHAESFVGDVFLALNRKTYDESSGEMLLSSLLIVSVTTLILIVATGFLVRRFLKGPLSSLNAIVDAYAAGVYEYEPTNIPYEEFQSFGRVLKEMGRKITEHIQKVKQAEEKYRNIFENAVEGIFQSTIDGRYLSASPSFAHMTGYDSPEELIGSITDIRDQCYVNPKDRDAFVRLLIENETVKGFEVQQYRKDRSTLWMSISGRLIRNDQGLPQYIEGFSIDITNRKNLETQLRQVQKMEAIGTLAGGIAHDFKNILGVIIGCTELSMVKTPESNDARIYMGKVLEAGKRATKLVNQILTFSRQSESEIKPIYLGRMVKETLKFIRATLPATIEIREEIITESGPALADPTQVHQVLMNLCTNAAHSMQPRGGVLEVRLTEVELPSGDIDRPADSKLQPYVELCIIDTGHGMTAETLERIFDPFFTTKPVGEGTGLGLSVVHGIVKKHNGLISVKSEPGKGSVFRIYFPRIDTRLLSVEDKQNVEFSKGAERILLVDDEQLLVDTLKEMLKDLGYSVTATNRSLDAHKMFRADPKSFDLVMTDLTMPDMTGIDLAREINRIDPDMPIILCTGFSELIQPDQARAAGIREILFKPVIRSQLSVAVRKVLE
jgi:PAS domain S-box-containing protein